MKKIHLLIITVFIAFQAFAQNPALPFSVSAEVMQYNGSVPQKQQALTFKNNQAATKLNQAEWQCKKTGTNQQGKETVYAFELTKGEVEKAGAALNFMFNNWSTDNYVIIPSAAYNGNRFDVLKYPYAPLFKSKDYKVDMPITITDVPRLNKYEGPSRMDLSTGDMSTPALGIYFPKTKKGVWIFAEQATELGNSVFIFKENQQRTQATFTIAAPCVRETHYTITRLNPSIDTGSDLKQGDKITIRYKVYTFDNLQSPKDLNNKFLTIRKTYGHSSYVKQLPFSKAFEIMEKQENEFWSPKDSVYTLGGETINMHWQLGWVGGLMVTLPLSELGGDSSANRSFLNYQKIITQTQAKSGFFYGCGDGKNWVSDCFGSPHPDNLHLLRKNADALYFIYKYALSQKNKNPNWQMPADWKEPMQKQIAAFIKLWNQYHQFGQFIDIETGEIKVGGTNSTMTAIAGLALAAKFDNKPAYLQTAKEAARYYYKNFILKGVSCGGPGEILQNNDAESAYATLEAFMVLYEITQEKEWLSYAQDAAGLCSTWTITYDYDFPKNSLFGRLDMKTTGVVWASTQNKHGGPGICTASGDCLFKLYRATGNKYYLGMIYDVAHNIMQYIARADRPIKDQHVGWINERVNLSDWEGRENVGDIFHGNTWAQVSAMLTVSEIPGIYINPQKKEVVAFDHVQAKLQGNAITVTNPTKFDAKVSVFIDENPDKAYPVGFISTCPKITVKAGETKTFQLADIK